MRHLSKKFITVIAFLTTIAFSCSETSENDPKSQSTLIGTWEIVEVFDGSLTGNQQVRDQYLIDFDSSVSCFTTHPTIGCPSDYDTLFGTYSIKNDSEGDILECKFDCSGAFLDVSFYYGFDGENLLLSPNPSTCPEGCYEKFRRL